MVYIYIHIGLKQSVKTNRKVNVPLKNICLSPQLYLDLECPHHELDKLDRARVQRGVPALG